MNAKRYIHHIHHKATAINIMHLWTRLHRSEPAGTVTEPEHGGRVRLPTTIRPVPNTSGPLHRPAARTQLSSAFNTVVPLQLVSRLDPLGLDVLGQKHTQNHPNGHRGSPRTCPEPPPLHSARPHLRVCWFVDNMMVGLGSGSFSPGGASLARKAKQQSEACISLP